MEEVHIGHYILGKTIGTGAFAKVKQAKHDITGVKVAIKIINKRKMKNKSMISKVKREIKILKFINHPNIIKLYEVLDTTNDIFVIMELAPKGELYDFIQNNDIDEPLAKFYFQQIINGVQYAHQNLITHRDLKPENILIDNNNLIKIVDFGLSNLMKDGKLLKTSCGSPNYASPEIVGERKYEGTSVDIWSCGVILFALLTGSLPFDEEAVALLHKKIEQGNYTIPSTVSRSAADLISRMLQVDPCNRIRIYEIKKHPWIQPHLPIYYRIPSSFSYEKEQEFQLDTDIYKHVKQMNVINVQENSEEKIVKSIKKRDDQSFVIIYQLLRDQKYRKVYAEEVLSNANQKNYKETIFQQIQNIIIPKTNISEQQFQFGKTFSKPPKILAEKVIEALKKLGIQFSIKSADYCMKCVYVPFQYKQFMKKMKSIQLQNEDDVKVDKELKFTKKQIKFTLQIYAINPKGFDHLIDLQLAQGHPLVFFTVAKNFYDLVTELANYY